jgi:hypothetical protein
MEAMTDTWLGRLFWRVADDLDYLVTLASLRVLDALPVPRRRRWRTCSVD